MVRQGYRRLLEAQPDISIVGEAATAREAFDQYQLLEPDVLVLDLGLPDMGGVELISRLRQRHSHARILVFTMHREPVFATQALRAGALGYVTKSSPPDFLVEAVYRVAARRQVISPDIAPNLALALVDRSSEALDVRSDIELTRAALRLGLIRA